MFCSQLMLQWKALLNLESPFFLLTGLDQLLFLLTLLYERGDKKRIHTFYVFFYVRQFWATMLYIAVGQVCL